MSEPLFQFNLYRLNIVDDGPFLEFMGHPLRGDADVRKLLKAATSPTSDQTIENERNTFKWSLREYIEFTPEGGKHGDAVRIVLARSHISEAGQTVTDQGMIAARSETTPPLAIPVNLIFYMPRHTVAVENVSSVLVTDGWRRAFSSICEAAARSLELTSTLHLEPIPGQDEILSVFRSFSTLIMLRVRLRIPNPEVDRITKRMMDDMEKGGVRDYLHQMYNPNGLNQAEDAVPFAAASLAQAGYKEGEVAMEGVQKGKRKKIKTGLKAARSTVDVTRDFVRGALSNAKTQEAKQVLASIISEMDRVSPPPKGEGTPVKATPAARRQKAPRKGKKR